MTVQCDFAKEGGEGKYACELEDGYNCGSEGIGYRVTKEDEDGTCGYVGSVICESVSV